MYLSRIQLRFNQLRPEMLAKWDAAAPYASHQWLWQLFPELQTRHFLFRQELKGGFFVLSATPPLIEHNLFQIETRPFKPQLGKGALLDFQLRANPVVTRNGKRSDVMMDAKYQAKVQGIPQPKWWALQQEAAQHWLTMQGQQHGFTPVFPDSDSFASWAGDDDAMEPAKTCVTAYTQHRFARKEGEKPIVFSSVDFAGTLRVTDPVAFERALFTGLGKSKALGCGLLMVKRRT
ncbi:MULTISPECIES: type I-E CRISPR-associated protein Cas6/Cse3/CasE [Enterobacterales]|uniref:type I-E CRISPR-associated protein Cas6/Cse3/CasE n=1 Tax=Enterobacterales TaxID=91347 RepID=UPI002EDA5911